MLKKQDFFILIFFCFLFFAFSYFGNPLIFKYRFDESLIKDYLRSQDIEDKEDKIKDRIFISDDKIYLASGVLYAKGEDPSKFNFQHPPLIKYLFGFSSLLFGTPYVIQFLFSLAFIFLVYFLGILVFKSHIIPVLSLAFIFADPVFWENARSTLLDMGQVVFALSFLILFFYFPGKTFPQGLFLGLLFSSKFWSFSALFLMFLVIYKAFFLDKSFRYKSFLKIFSVSFIVFCLSYFAVFWYAGGILDIVLLQLKTLKFMLTHNVANTFGNLFLLFISGHYFSWWGGGLVKSEVWSFLWPVLFFVNLFLVFKYRKDKKLWWFFVFPVFYFLVNLTNTAFTRYLLFVLPFLYLSISYFIVNLLKEKINL